MQSVLICAEWFCCGDEISYRALLLKSVADQLFNCWCFSPVVKFGCVQKSVSGCLAKFFQLIDFGADIGSKFGHTAVVRIKGRPAFDSWRVIFDTRKDFLRFGRFVPVCYRHYFAPFAASSLSDRRAVGRRLEPLCNIVNCNIQLFCMNLIGVAKIAPDTASHATGGITRPHGQDQELLVQMGTL